jgi:hypothetical protein
MRVYDKAAETSRETGPQSHKVGRFLGVGVSKSVSHLWGFSKRAWLHERNNEVGFRSESTTDGASVQR